MFPNHKELDEWMKLDEARESPITTDWLKKVGFLRHSGRSDRNQFWRLPVADKKMGGRGFMESPDDICIDLAPVGQSPEDVGTFHVWIAQEEPYRHIHVRHMRYQHEIKDLYKGLVGLDMEEGA